MSPVPRRTIERRSGPLLVLLSRQNKLVLPVTVGALLLVSLVLPKPVDAVPLVLLLLLISWLTYLSWPVLDGGGRAIRLGVLAMVLFLLAVSF